MNRMVVAAALTFAVATAAACSGTGGRGGSPDAGKHLVDGGTLTIAVAEDPGNLDPQNTVLAVDGEFATFAYDTLVAQNPNGRIVSSIAQSWQASGNTYRFTVRPGVTCADGTPLTASRVAANFRYLADPASKSPLLGLYVPPGLKAGADDAARTVELKLTAPFPFFLTGLTAVPIVCPKGLANRKLLAQHTDGSGPYVLSSAVAGASYTYTVRSGYTWGPGGASTAQKGMPAKVVFKIVPNDTTAANLLLAGQVNLAAASEPDRPRIDATHLTHHDLRTPVGEMYFNESAGRPAADENVRRALVMAADLSQLGKVMTGGSGQPSHGMVTVDPKPCQGDTVSGNVPSHDPAGAAKLLDQAGWQMGSGGVRTKNGKTLSLTLIYTSTDNLGPAAELAVSQWKAAGVKVNAVAKPKTEISSTLFDTGNWDISWAPLKVQLPSQLVPFLSGPAPADGANFGHLNNADYTHLAGAAAAKPDAAGCAQWTDAEKALIKAVDVVPYYDQLQPLYAKNATFELAGGGPVVTSLRLLAG